MLHNSLKLQKNLIFGLQFVSKGIFFADVSSWRQGRNILAQAFNFESLINKVPVIKGVIKEAIDDMKNQNKVNNDKINIISEMQKISGEIAVRTFMGISKKNVMFGKKTFN